MPYNFAFFCLAENGDENQAQPIRVREREREMLLNNFVPIKSYLGKGWSLVLLENEKLCSTRVQHRFHFKCIMNRINEYRIILHL